MRISRVIACLALTACGGSAGAQATQQPTEAGALADVEAPEGGALEAGLDVADAGREAADGGTDAPAEVGAEAGEDGGAPAEAGGDEAGALAACIEHACNYANPGQGGANCGVLPGVTCGGQPVDCSAWQGAPSGGCSPSLPADYVCGGSGVANQCGNWCESTVEYTNACLDAYNLPYAWAVVQACGGASAGPTNPVPYSITNGSVTWRSQPVTVGCTAYVDRDVSPPVSIYCCD